MGTAALSADHQNRAAELMLLRQSLGCDLSLVKRERDTDTWKSDNEQTVALNLDQDTLQFLCDQAQRFDYAVKVTDQSIILCLKFVEAPSGTEFVLGELVSIDVVLAEKLAAMATQLLRQQRQIANHEESLQNCLEQLTYSFEEQSWIRSLTKCMQACTLQRDMPAVLHDILPSLKLQTCSAAVGFLPVPRPLTPQPIMYWSGMECGETSDWLRWISQVESKFHQGPIIQNSRAVTESLAQQGIVSVCVAPVQQGDHVYGWIIAINRHDEAHWMAPSAINQSWDMEYTTVEAGLIEAACGMLAAHLNNRDLFQDRENLILGVIHCMSAAIDARDPYTRGHSERVARYGRRLARALGVEEATCARIYLAGLMHDVGKIGVPDFVLQKPGKLTDEEFALIKKHPDLGAIIIESLPQLSDLKPGVLHHHERIDGRGYPAGLAGEEIPPMARILAIADTYDALTSNRPYRDSMSHDKARDILQLGAGTQWDAEMVATFLRIPVEEIQEDTRQADQNGWKTDEFSLRSGVASLQLKLATDYQRTVLQAGVDE